MTAIKPCPDCGQWPFVILYDDGSVAAFAEECEHRGDSGNFAPQEQGLPAAFPREGKWLEEEAVDDRLSSKRVTHHPLIDP